MRRSGLVLLCVTAWLVPARSQTPAQQRATAAYVRGLQDADGGFAPATPGPSERPAASSVRATVAALRALKYSGGQPRDRAACARFIQNCYDRATGGFADRPGGRPDVTSTAVGIMGVVELQMPVGDYRKGMPPPC
jgi:prenyltransferase beta subunit